MSRPTFQLIHGDALDVLAEMTPERRATIAAVVTDPPYGMAWRTDSTRYTGGAEPRGEGRADWGPIPGDASPFDPTPWLAWDRVILWGANHFSERLPSGSRLIWIKRRPAAFGSFLSDAEIAWMSGGRGVYCHEDASGNLQRIREGCHSRKVHPSQKPESLMAWCLERLQLPPGSTVFDPYMGSGTTGVAAVRMGHSFIGVDIDPRCVQVARRRLEHAAPLFARSVHA